PCLRGFSLAITDQRPTAIFPSCCHHTASHTPTAQPAQVQYGGTFVPHSHPVHCRGLFGGWFTTAATTAAWPLPRESLFGDPAKHCGGRSLGRSATGQPVFGSRPIRLF
ncbi:unnamed protein product, partial [Ectocarpus sp. 12 AP-2014]